MTSAPSSFVELERADRRDPAFGADFSVTQVALARGRYPEIRFEEASADALPFPPVRFDAVVSSFGKVRASATLRTRTAEARAAIVAGIKRSIEAYRDGDGYAVPMPAVLASARKP